MKEFVNYVCVETENIIFASMSLLPRTKTKLFETILLSFAHAQQLVGWLVVLGLTAL